MNFERKRIEALITGNGTIGFITLDKLAIPETVKVTLLGEPIIPESFDCYGHPNFTEEQEMLYMFKEEELKRMNGGKYIPLKAEIIYEERSFDVPRDTFDTVDGIESSLLNLSDLNEMLQNRRIFRKAHEKQRLNEFMLFGCFWLDQFGQVMSIEKKAKGKLETKGDVEEYETFRRHNSVGFSLVSSGGYVIPTAGSVCPCCGKAFTIEDIRNNPCVYAKGKFYHDSCWSNYRKLTEIDRFTRRMMSIIYEDSDYQFELLPNGYCSREGNSHIPWFLFHTIDGDIIMGWRKRVISIEWQENYKPFDINELFGTEDVTKWENGGKRGIHAWDYDKAYEYLKKVLETVNPNYSKW